MIKRVIRHFWLKRLKARGLQIADDCRLIGYPKFGSEPFLISIGAHVTVSSEVTFITHDGGTYVFRDQPRYREVIKFGRITIHDNCFIGSRSVLMPGISIGPNSVIAAGSVVTKDVAPNTVAGGVPARPICSVAEYAERSLARIPEYDRVNFLSNKEEELLRRYPRPW